MSADLNHVSAKITAAMESLADLRAELDQIEIRSSVEDLPAETYPRPDFDVTVGRNIQRLRKDRGWSQTTLAERLQQAGLDTFYQVTVGRMEAGERPVRLQEGLVLASILRVSLADLTNKPNHKETAA